MKRVLFTKLVKIHENASMGAVGAGAIATTAIPLGQKKRKKKKLPVQKRKKSNLEEAAGTPYLYHATFTKNVPKIMKQGLQHFKTSNWVKAGTGKRYNEDAGIFAFEHPEDAFKWAFKMNWEFKKDISIVRLKLSDVWEKDPSTDYSLQGRGRSMRAPAPRNIPASDMIDVFHMKDFGVPMDRGISADEWIEDSARIMSEDVVSFGQQWAPSDIQLNIIWRIVQEIIKKGLGDELNDRFDNFLYTIEQYNEMAPEAGKVSELANLSERHLAQIYQYGKSIDWKPLTRGGFKARQRQIAQSWGKETTA